LAGAVAAAIAALLGTAVAISYGRGPLPAKAVDVAPSSTQILAVQPTEVVGPRHLRAENGNVLLLAGAAVRVVGPGSLELQQGSLVVDGQAVVVAHGTRLTIDGVAGVSTEPGDAFLHVMQGLQSTPEGKDYLMKISRWPGQNVVLGTASVALVL